MKSSKQTDTWQVNLFFKEEIATVLKEAETIDNQEDDACKIDPEQEALQKKLSDRTYLKGKLEEALEVMKLVLV